MKYPNFLSIEASNPDENSFPTVISWSLEDGSIKSVLIIPDDEWEPWENAGHDIDVQLLQDQGVSGPDIIRELNEDLDGKTVFTDGFNFEEELVEKLFETYGHEAGFELAPVKSLYKNWDLETMLAKRSEVAFENDIHLEQSEDLVRANIFLVHSFPNEIN